MSIFINATTTLWADHGIVNIEATTLDPSEGYVHLEIDARQLLKDIPSLYEMCLLAIEKEDKHIKEKYKQFKKKL
tara:strand:+ start:607 stop:831 length:225 start_codon:yes stop_codon:yes gene_type:complete